MSSDITTPKNPHNNSTSNTQLSRAQATRHAFQEREPHHQASMRQDITPSCIPFLNTGHAGSETDSPLAGRLASAALVRRVARRVLHHPRRKLTAGGSAAASRCLHLYMNATHVSCDSQQFESDVPKHCTVPLSCQHHTAIFSDCGHGRPASRHAGRCAACSVRSAVNVRPRPCCTRNQHPNSRT